MLNRSLLIMTQNQENVSENQNNPSHIDQCPLDEQLNSATGGSFISAVSDVFDTTIRFASGGIGLGSPSTEERMNRSELRNKTGQTSLVDALKWEFAPNTMEEKTREGIQDALNEAAIKNEQAIDQYKADHGA